MHPVRGFFVVEYLSLFGFDAQIAVHFERDVSVVHDFCQLG